MEKDRGLNALGELNHWHALWGMVESPTYIYTACQPHPDLGNRAWIAHCSFKTSTITSPDAFQYGHSCNGFSDPRFNLFHSSSHPVALHPISVLWGRALPPYSTLG